MSLKTRTILVIVIGVVMGFGLSFGGAFLDHDTPASKEDLAWEQARLFSEVLERVKRDYLEPVDDELLFDSAIRGMVADLDDHSEYLDASEYRDIRISTAGSYTGIGVEVAQIDDSIRVISPIAGSPAARSGIRSGDKLVAVDGRPVEGDHLQDTIGLLRGDVGSKITLTVMRDEQLITHRMRRQFIRVASVHRELLDPSYGYVRINQFSDSTAEELSLAVDALHESGNGMLDGLVLDLRNNPGGVLESAVEVSDLFLDSGVIVTADGRSKESRFTRFAHHGDILDGASMIVLVNGGSASAAEIVAGALQDHNRATLIGTVTFGKGLVQTVLPLSKGRAVKLTTSRYYTPSGDSIHGIGVTPDVFVGETPGFPDMSLLAVIDRDADAQLAEALQQLRSRAVMHSSAR